MSRAFAFEMFVGLLLISGGCARVADPETYAFPSATAAEFRTVVCPGQRLAPATVVVCPDSNK